MIICSKKDQFNFILVSIITFFIIVIVVLYSLLSKNIYVLGLGALALAIFIIIHSIKAIHYRQQIDEFILQTEEKYKSYILNCPEAVYVFDKDLKFIEVNNCACNLLGYTEDELIGTSITNKIAEDLKDNILKNFEILENFGKFSGEIIYQKKDGALIVLYVDCVKNAEDNFICFAKDITERKQREEINKKKLDLFEVIFEDAEIGLLIIDIEGNIIETNDKLNSILGYEPKELLSKNCKEITYPEDMEICTHFFDQLINRQINNCQFEKRYLKKDGSNLWMKVTATATYGDDDQLESIISVLVDLTEQKKTEEELINLQNQHRAILDNIPDTAWLKDKNSNYIAVNKSFCQSYGLTKEEIIGKTDYYFTSLKQAQKYINEDQQVIQSGNIMRFEDCWNDKSGNTYWEDIIKIPIKNKNGEIIATAGIARDVTQRKQDEESLLMTKISVDMASVITLWVKKDGTLHNVNEEAVKVFGYTREELLSKTIFDINQEIKPEIWPHLLNQLKENKVYKYESTGIKKDGSTFLTEADVHYIEYEGEEYSFVFVQDITERKRLENELALKQTRLEEMVEEKTHQLRESLQNLQSVNMQLQETSKYKNKFISNMSHELRTPLNAILGFTELLRGYYTQDASSKQKEYINIINDSATNLLELIDGLLDISKIDSDSFELNITQFPQEEIFKNTINILLPQFKEKQISINIQYDPQVNFIHGDLHKSKQIALNLLTNALKYTPAGGNVTVTSEKISDLSAKFSIIDTGLGIREEEKEKIFTEFYQSEDVKDLNVGKAGTGIGLSLCKKFASIQGGEIGLESKLGEGSKFWFTLPMVASISSSNSQSPEDKQGKVDDNKLILVVEDNPLNLRLILDILHALKYKIVVAHNGEEAIDKAIYNNPDLILMDIRMPVMDGIEAVKRLRANNEFSNTPIIALTASAGLDARARHIEAGFTDHLDKPYTFDSLIDVLNNYLMKNNN